MVSKQHILLGSVIKQTDVRIINLTPANVCFLILVTKNINFTICIADKKFTLYCPRDEFISEGGRISGGSICECVEYVDVPRVWSATFLVRRCLLWKKEELLTNNRY
jgi:hypothetical protein